MQIRPGRRSNGQQCTGVTKVPSEGVNIKGTCEYAKNQRRNDRENWVGFGGRIEKTRPLVGCNREGAGTLGKKKQKLASLLDRISKNNHGKGGKKRKKGEREEVIAGIGKQRGGERRIEETCEDQRCTCPIGQDNNKREDR